MRPVYQRHVGDKGDCFASCVASIMELDHEMVPNFVEAAGDRHFLDYANEWMAEHGLQILWWKPSHGCTPKGWAILAGKSPRNESWSHAVVAFDGVSQFDPHPSNEGVLSQQAWYVIVPLGPASKQEEPQ